MLCTFCGTDNRPESKFCGMCGVGLERRKVERRFTSHQDGRRCPLCNHVNETGYKFCAMCGSPVEHRVVERRTDQPRAVATANAQLPGPEGPHVAVSEPEPIEDAYIPPTTIRGPSFLGLSDDGGNSDYLLDDEGSSGSVLRSLVLVAVLAALGGLVYLQWKAGFPVYYVISDRIAEWAKVELGPLAKQEQKPQAIAPQANTESRTIELKKPSSAELKKDSTAANEGTPTAKNKPPADLAPIASAAPTPTSATPTRVSRHEVVTPLKAKPVKAGQDPPSPMLLRAQQYLQGTGGVPKNCEQGLVYLRAAAKNEAAAAVELSALYASGHCVPIDRVQAYRWLNSAHELQPGDPTIQTSMNQLWALMTVKERSQIVR